MAKRTASVFAAFAITLVLVNAHCFVQCLVQSCDPGTPPCHSSNHSSNKTSPVCPQQHEVKAAAVTHVDAGAQDIAYSAVQVDYQAPTLAATRVAEIRPREPVVRTASLPLRI